MLKIRLQRIGRRNKSSFRIVVTENTKGPKSGKFVERLGFFNPHTDEMKVNYKRAKHWISVGAKPTDTAYNILVSLGIIEGKKRNALPKKTPVVKDTPEDENNSSEEVSGSGGASEEGTENTSEDVSNTEADNGEESENDSEDSAGTDSEIDQKKEENS